MSRSLTEKRNVKRLKTFARLDQTDFVVLHIKISLSLFSTLKHCNSVTITLFETVVTIFKIIYFFPYIICLTKLISFHSLYIALCKFFTQLLGCLFVFNLKLRPYKREPCSMVYLL